MPPGRPDISGPASVTTAISLAVHSAERGVCHNQRNFGSRSLRERRRSRLDRVKPYAASDIGDVRDAIDYEGRGQRNEQTSAAPEHARHHRAR